MTNKERYLSKIAEKSASIQDSRKRVNILESEMSLLFKVSKDDFYITTLHSAFYKEIRRIKCSIEKETLELYKMYANYGTMKNNRENRRADLMESMYTEERVIS